MRPEAAEPGEGTIQLEVGEGRQSEGSLKRAGLNGNSDHAVRALAASRSDVTSGAGSRRDSTALNSRTNSFSR